MANLLASLHEICNLLHQRAHARQCQPTIRFRYNGSSNLNNYALAIHEALPLRTLRNLLRGEGSLCSWNDVSGCRGIQLQHDREEQSSTEQT